MSLVENRQSPPTDWIPITPSDVIEYRKPIRLLRIASSDLGGNGGVVRVTMSSGSVRDLPIAAGEEWVLSVQKVHQTGTDAEVSALWGAI